MTTKLLKILLFAYGTIFSYLLFLSGIRNFRSSSDLILLLILSPVAGFFLLSIFKQMKIFSPEKTIINSSLKHLKIISLINSLLLVFVAVYGAIFYFNFVFILMIFPLPIYFVILNFERKNMEIKSVEKQLVNPVALVLKKNVKLKKSLKEDDQKVGEPMRRKFLKVLGGVGIGFILMSIINPRKAQASFFGSVPGPGTVSVKDTTGAKIDPAIKSPTDAYGITQIADTTPAYYGFVNKSGAWYITREEADGSYRYFKGLTDFASSWLNRGGLSYNYFDTVFSS
jgi:hypothetical protein